MHAYWYACKGTCIHVPVRTYTQAYMMNTRMRACATAYGLHTQTCKPARVHRHMNLYRYTCPIVRRLRLQGCILACLPTCAHTDRHAHVRTYALTAKHACEHTNIRTYILATEIVVVVAQTKSNAHTSARARVGRLHRQTNERISKRKT